MKETILEVKDVCFSYEEHGPLALNHMNLEIQKGERIAVIGANGAGKSTLFLTINGVLTPDSGEVLFHGTKIYKKNQNWLRKNVGIVFQEADQQIIASTVYGEVAFGPMNLKLSREEVKKAVDDALDYMNLTQLSDRPPQYLSGGEKKRVSIADVLSMNSEVILLDEPTVALDPMNEELLEQVLDGLSSQGKTLVVATHDVDFAYRFADRILVFLQAEILADDDPVAVFTNEKLLESAHLKKPVLLETARILQEKNLLKKGCFPKTVDELNSAIITKI